MSNVIKTFSNKCLSLSYMGEDWNNNLIQSIRDKNLRFAYYKHTFTYSKDKSKWHLLTTLIVKIVDEETAWCYATNQKPSLLLIMEYKKRWNIETGFRIHDETRIKSKSNNSFIRFFYHL